MNQHDDSGIITVVLPGDEADDLAMMQRATTAPPHSSSHQLNPVANHSITNNDDFFQQLEAEANMTMGTLRQPPNVNDNINDNDENAKRGPALPPTQIQLKTKEYQAVFNDKNAAAIETSPEGADRSVLKCLIILDEILQVNAVEQMLAKRRMDDALAAKNEKLHQQRQQQQAEDGGGDPATAAEATKDGDNNNDEEKLLDDEEEDESSRAAAKAAAEESARAMLGEKLSPLTDGEVVGHRNFEYESQLKMMMQRHL